MPLAKFTPPTDADVERREAMEHRGVSARAVWLLVAADPSEPN